jgi:hypothetical protein
LAAIGKNLAEFTLIADAEKVILKRIGERFTDMGGWDNILSKEIGWTL